MLIDLCITMESTWIQLSCIVFLGLMPTIIRISLTVKVWIILQVIFTSKLEMKSQLIESSSILWKPDLRSYSLINLKYWKLKCTNSIDYSQFSSHKSLITSKNNPSLLNATSSHGSSLYSLLVISTLSKVIWLICYGKDSLFGVGASSSNLF